jgi:hypothetical protein
MRNKGSIDEKSHIMINTISGPVELLYDKNGTSFIWRSPNRSSFIPKWIAGSHGF